MMNISQRDKEILNGLFVRMNRNLKIDEDACYISYDECTEDLFRKGNKQKFNIQIRGFKKRGNNISPVWRILPDRHYY